jgi:hypothetical protein
MDTHSVMTSPLLWTLVAIQIAMGGFDVVFHHEITERLAWRRSAAHELRLHAVRNLFYALLFAAFAWLKPTGLLAVLLIVIMAAEIVITLADFVEEDMTRKLPATERVLHTLLAINYGAIIALAGPEIVAWASLPSGLERVDYGWGSVLLTGAAVGVALFGLRDLATSRRAAAFVPPCPVPLADTLPGPRRRVLVTGGTGFIGRALVEALTAAGHEVTVLTRDVGRADGLATPVRLVKRLDDIRRTDRIDAVVDLAGEPVAGGPWTLRRRQAVVASRLRTLNAVGRLVERLDVKPAVVIKASAVGFYGVRGDDLLTEADGAGARREFAVRSCRIVERAARDLGRRHGVRTVALRIGLVLGREGGLLGRLLPVFDLGLGGRTGAGQQWMSWISLDDVVRLIGFAIAEPSVEGAVNGTAPVPVRNRDFARALGRVLRRPAILPLPALPLEWVLGDFARELLTGGQRVVPAKATACGFRFLDADLETALRVAVAGRRMQMPCSAPEPGRATSEPVAAA